LKDYRDRLAEKAAIRIAKKKEALKQGFF